MGQYMHTAGWTEDRVATLRDLWREGLSASQIAAKLGGGISRNGVIGKIHRLGINGASRPKPSPAAVRAPRAPKPVAQPVMRAVPVVRANGAVSFRVKPGTAIDPAAPDIAIAGAPDPSTNVTMAGLTSTTCRWPLGDPASPDFRYCGAYHGVEDGPYCRHHHRIAHTPAKPRRTSSKESMRAEAVAAI